MIYITDNTLDRFIKEDVPYIDLTTQLLDIGNIEGKITFRAREDIVVSGSEEVLRILEKLNVKSLKFVPSGTELKKGEILIEGKGLSKNLHIAWKVCLNILEYCCGIATKTKRFVDKVESINNEVSIVATRKSFPGTKELVIKSIMSGGAFPHRLGLSETVIIFNQHINLVGGIENLVKKIREIKIHACEKKIIVEVDNINDALLVVNAGVDGIQFDKLSPDYLRECVIKCRDINPNILLIATGGITENNAAEYANTGVNAIATTSVYFGKPSDISAKIEPIK